MTVTQTGVDGGDCVVLQKAQSETAVSLGGRANAVHQMRNADPVAATLDLWPEHPRPPAPRRSPPERGGVGARQARPAPPGAGGGYLDGCTASELRADPRLRELAEIGLSATWLSVARQLGYDQFVAMWRLLSSDPALRNDDDQIELHLRPFRAFERYQRNRYITTLVLAGMKPRQIHELVRKDLGERLSRRHVMRLAAEGRRKGPVTG